MYEQAFNFTQRPFKICPAPEEFYQGRSHQQAVEASRVCIERRNGPVVLIGSVGSGKSLTTQVIGEEHAGQFDVVSIECSRLEQRSELLQSILFGLGLPFREMSEGELRLSLIEHLKNGNGSSEGMLLLVDEADRLSIELLDELRLITNVVREGRSQVQLVLAGTQRLEESLNDPRLASFNQRVASRYFLQNLSHTEVAEYISQHIARAGGDSESVFDKCAIEEIARCTDGCPRLINQVCEKALAEAANDSLSSIDQQVVQQAWAKLQNLPVPNRSQLSSETSEQACDGGSGSVVEFGSLSDDQDFDSSISVGCESGEGDCGSQCSGEDDREIDTQSYKAVSESTGFLDSATERSGQNDEVEASVESFDDETEEQTESASFSAEPVSDETATNDPEIESDPSNDWSGRLPTNLGVNDFRMEYGAQSSRYSMPPMGSSGDPFAPESSGDGLDHLAFQDNRETGNLDETSDFYGQSYCSSDQDTSGYEAQSTDSQETDARIEALQQEQKDLIDQVDSVTNSGFSTSSIDDAESAGDSDDQSSESSTTQADVEAAFQGLQQIDQARSTELPQSQQVPQAAVEAAIDPFEEDFEEEVLLHDTYSPFVAQQNQSSLTVTSENLAHLSPSDEEGTADQIDATHADGEINFAADDESSTSHLQSGFSFPVPPADTSFVPVQSVQTEISLSSVGFDADAAENSAAEVEDGSSDPEDPIDPELAALTSDFPFEEESQDQSVSSWNNTPQTIEQSPPQNVHDQSYTQFGQDEGDRVAQEIQEDAQGIVQELRSTIESDVPRENVEPPAAVSFGVESPNQSFSEETRSEEPRSEHEENSIKESFFKSAETLDSNNDESKLDSNQQILRDILDQQRLINEQKQAGSFDSSSPSSDGVDSISVEYPITDHQNYQAPSDIENDDRDMLRVSETQYNQPQKEAFEDRSPLADATPSTGEAQRLDYGQLFDQLRNLPKE